MLSPFQIRPRTRTCTKVKRMTIMSGLQYLDFIPECTKSAGILESPTFERFSAVVEKANLFLSQNPGVIIKTCETIRHRWGKAHLKEPNSLSFWQCGGIISGYYVHGLRLWYTTATANQSKEEKRNDDDKVAQIGYFHVLPQCGKDSLVQDTMDTLTEKLHRTLRDQTLAGSLLTVETIETRGKKLESSGLLDPDFSTGPKRIANYNVIVMTFLRVWYQCGPPTMKNKTVKMATFVPELNLQTILTGIFRKEESRILVPRYVEIYPKIVEYLNSWRQQVPRNAKILSIRTHSTRIKTDGSFDCHSTCKEENRDTPNKNLRFIRVFHQGDEEHDAPPSYPTEVPHITCKLFLPGFLGKKLFTPDPQFESADQLRDRLDHWTTATGAKVLSVETMAYKAFTGQAGLYGADVTCSQDAFGDGKNQNHLPEQCVIGYRVFMEGFFGDPPNYSWPPSLDDWRAKRAEETCILQ